MFSSDIPHLFPVCVFPRVSGPGFCGFLLVSPGFPSFLGLLVGQMRSFPVNYITHEVVAGLLFTSRTDLVDEWY